jgi:hypothetical protein
MPQAWPGSDADHRVPKLARHKLDPEPLCTGIKPGAPSRSQASVTRSSGLEARQPVGTNRAAYLTQHLFANFTGRERLSKWSEPLPRASSRNRSLELVGITFPLRALCRGLMFNPVLLLLGILKAINDVIIKHLMRSSSIETSSAECCRACPSRHRSRSVEWPSCIACGRLVGTT